MNEEWQQTEHLRNVNGVVAKVKYDESRCFDYNWVWECKVSYDHVGIKAGGSEKTLSKAVERADRWIDILLELEAKDE